AACNLLTLIVQALGRRWATPCPCSSDSPSTFKRAKTSQPGPPYRRRVTRQSRELRYTVFLFSWLEIDFSIRKFVLVHEKPVRLPKSWSSLLKSSLPLSRSWFAALSTRFPLFAS